MNKTTKTLVPALVLIAGIAIIAFGVWNNMQNNKDDNTTVDVGDTLTYADPASGLNFAYPTTLELMEETTPIGFSLTAPHTADAALPMIIKEISFSQTDTTIALMQKTKTTELDAWLKTTYPEKVFTPTDPLNGNQAYQHTMYYDEFGERSLTRAPKTATYLVGRYTFFENGPWVVAMVEYWHENTNDAEKTTISTNATKLYTAITTSIMLNGLSS